MLLISTAELPELTEIYILTNSGIKARKTNAPEKANYIQYENTPIQIY